MIKALKIKKNDETNILNKRSKSEKVLFGIVFCCFALYGLSLIYPFVWLFLSSLKEGIEYDIDLVTNGVFDFPDKANFRNYINAFTNMKYRNIGFITMFFNSIWFTAITAVNSVFVNAITGYCLSKYKFKLKKVIFTIAIFSMTIPVVGTMGAYFKLITGLGLYDSPLLIFLTSLAGFGFNFLIMHAFFSNISWSYAEAVFIDGGGHFTVFFKIMLPQARPPMFTLIIMAGIGAWNDYMTPILYLPSFPTVASGLYFIEKSLMRGFVLTYFAGLIISIIPVLVIFSVFSDLIMKNFTMGGLKG